MEPLPETTILDLSKLKDLPKAVKLTHVIHAVESGLVLCLWWDDLEGDSLILPLEGKGFLDFERVGGLHNPRNPGWTGHVQMTSKHLTPGSKCFTIVLGFSKMRE